MLESRSFLRARAVTESGLAHRATCAPAALSHDKLARLYLSRCAVTEGSPKDCIECTLEPICQGVMSQYN
ncbi:hypothetical protein BH09PSE3_BH09PSE3_15540 [soil metagenome]